MASLKNGTMPVPLLLDTQFVNSVAKHKGNSIRNLDYIIGGPDSPHSLYI